jgi:hypothetical protein
MYSSIQNNKLLHLSESINSPNNNEVGNNKKIDKFAILNDKISSLSENKNAKKFKAIMETKINEVENNFKTNIESLEQKYDILNEQIGKFSKMLDEEKDLKEKKKIKNEEELKEFEQDITNLLSEEREFLKSYVDDCVKKIEDLLGTHSQEIKEEKEIIKENIENLKN